jgi:transcriptional regulator GlxA family with amidase domain
MITLQRLRVKEASGLLSGSSRSATEIALVAGFSPGQHFRFRKINGRHPASGSATGFGGRIEGTGMELSYDEHFTFM